MSCVSKNESFEKMMTRLEEIVATMEKGSCDLEESMKLFEEGVALTAKCEERLTSARQKIIELSRAEEMDSNE